MNNSPLVSIVVPIYNVEKYLEACVDSLICQTYSRIEIILVDDGATDGSGVLCDRLGERDERIKVIHKSNGGLSDARNTGVRHAGGEYLMFVDSDDQVDSRIVELLMECLEENDADVAICDPAHVFGDYAPEYTVSKERTVYDPQSAICEMWYQTSFLPSAWGKLYRTELLSDVIFRVGIIYEDIDMLHLVFAQARAVVHTPSALYAYKHREGSITNQKFSKRDCEILNICDRLCEYAAAGTPELQRAARAYSVVGALRVELNAPEEPEFESDRKRARESIERNRAAVLRDRRVRRKTKIGLILYRYCKPLMKFIHARINRWK